MSRRTRTPSGSRTCSENTRKTGPLKMAFDEITRASLDFAFLREADMGTLYKDCQDCQNPVTAKIENRHQQFWQLWQFRRFCQSGGSDLFCYPRQQCPTKAKHASPPSP